MYSRGTWNKWVLIPLWVVHISFELVFVGVLAFMMMQIAGSLGYVPAAYSAFLAIFVIALISEPLEMIFDSHRALEPWLYLSFQVFKALFATLFFIITVVGYAQSKADAIAIWGIAILIGKGLSFYASLAYGAVVVHRHRKEGGYTHVRKRSQGVQEMA